MAARPTRARAAALLLVGAAVVIALVSPVLSAGLAHRSAATAGIFGITARTAAVTTTVRGPLGQATDAPGAAVQPAQAQQVAQSSRLGAPAAGLHLTGTLAGAVLLVAFAGRRLPSRVRSRTPSDADRATARNRGPPRAAPRLA